MTIKALTEMERDQAGTVNGVKGGQAMSDRLEKMGIRPGQKITKLSAHLWRGPITVRVGRSKVAIGHGMATKILVEV